jgi:hypothetical protein
MSRDVRSLEAEAAASAEAARELREAAAALVTRHAALVTCHAADEDDLRRRAAALDAELRRLQGSLSALDPCTVDKVAFSPPPSGRGWSRFDLSPSQTPVACKPNLCVILSSPCVKQ